MSRTVAILTGDLIGSTQARPEIVEATMAVIRHCASQIDGPTDFTRFRGDGWQMRLDQPGDCLRVCLLILARLREHDGVLSSRIAVGIGEEYPTHSHDLSTALGPAFTASGRALDQMKSDRLLAIEGLPKIDTFRMLAFTVAAYLADRWTKSQAEAMALKLLPDSPSGERSNEAIARKLGLTRQAVDARLKSADYPLLDELIQAFAAAYPTDLPHA